MAESWIKLNRDVWNDHIICADAEHFMIWCFLKSYAAYEARPAIFSGRVVTLKPGQLITGIQVIAERTGIERTKVARVLARFEKAGMIRQQVTRNGRIVTLTEDPAAVKGRAPDQPKGASGYRKGPAQKKDSVFSSDASYDLEAYAATAIGGRLWQEAQKRKAQTAENDENGPPEE